MDEVIKFTPAVIGVLFYAFVAIPSLVFFIDNSITLVLLQIGTISVWIGIGITVCLLVVDGIKNLSKSEKGT